MGTQINGTGVVTSRRPLVASGELDGVVSANAGGGVSVRAQMVERLRQLGLTDLAEEVNGDDLDAVASARRPRVSAVGKAALAPPREAYDRGAEGAAANGYAPDLGAGTSLGTSAGTAQRLGSIAALSGGGLSSKDAKKLERFGVAAGALAGAGIISTDGVQFHARRAVSARLADARDAGMIGMIGNEGIPIEDLIFYFLAYMSQKYEDKLREKMEEAALAEKMERRQEQRTNEARKVGSMISTGAGLVGTAFGPLGGIVGGLAGSLAGGGVESAAQKVNEIDSAVNGGAKSSTLLASEIQVLMHKWKQLTELLSNVTKTLHDMAMTPIRNIRS